MANILGLFFNTAEKWYIRSVYFKYFILVKSYMEKYSIEKKKHRLVEVFQENVYKYTEINHKTTYIYLHMHNKMHELTIIDLQICINI